MFLVTFHSLLFWMRLYISYLWCCKKIAFQMLVEGNFVMRFCCDQFLIPDQEKQNN